MKGRIPEKLPVINVHGTTSSKQPSAETSVIRPEMFPSTLFKWLEFFDAEFVGILTKAVEILSCIIEALQSSNYSQIRYLGQYFANYLGNLFLSNGILFLDDKMVMLPQLRAPIRMRLHKGHSGT